MWIICHLTNLWAAKLIPQENVREIYVEVERREEDVGLRRWRSQNSLVKAVGAELQRPVWRRWHQTKAAWEYRPRRKGVCVLRYLWHQYLGGWSAHYIPPRPTSKYGGRLQKLWRLGPNADYARVAFSAKVAISAIIMQIGPAWRFC